MLPVNSGELLHRHGGGWAPLREADHSPDDHDVERRLLRGGRLFRCDECDLDILVVPPDGQENR